MGPLDSLFISLVILIVLCIIHDDPGGGRRGRVPVANS
jgi:hypothetical protein